MPVEHLSMIAATRLDAPLDQIGGRPDGNRKRRGLQMVAMAAGRQRRIESDPKKDAIVAVIDIFAELSSWVPHQQDVSTPRPVQHIIGVGSGRGRKSARTEGGRK